METLKELIDKQHEAAKAEREVVGVYGYGRDEQEVARERRRDADVELRVYLHNFLNLPGNPREPLF